MDDGSTKHEDAQLARAIDLGVVIQRLEGEIAAARHATEASLEGKKQALKRARLELRSLLKCSGYPT